MFQAMDTEEKNTLAQRLMNFSRTPGRNRPLSTSKFGEDWETYAIKKPKLLNNVLSTVNNFHASSFPSLHNDFSRTEKPMPSVQNIDEAIKTLAWETSGCSTDSSSGWYDGDSDGDTSSLGRQIGPESEDSGPISLRITGLDSRQDLGVTRAALANALQKYTKILHLSIFTLRDGTIAACVMVPSLYDARQVISSMQRHRLGQHRIRISFQNTSPEQRHLIRCQVTTLLNELQVSKLPLFQFKEYFKNKYLTSVSVSELRRMRDICVIIEDENGRMIAANPEKKNSPIKERNNSFCTKHHTVLLGYMMEPSPLPNVMVSLPLLTERCHDLIRSHEGRVPLVSLDHCLRALYGSLPISDETGVSLEHLVSCVPGVEISQLEGFKFLTWPRNTKPVERSGSFEGLTSQLLELLKVSPRSVLSFSSFISSYHRHFGKQFRLSEFGHTKLLDLLESLPHILQVTGFGSRKELTLSHRTQMKRFKLDLGKLLNIQPNKYIQADQFAMLYEAHFNKKWEPSQYGLCYLVDLLKCVVCDEIRMVQSEDGIMRIYTRQQTVEERERTKRFKGEVVQLLKLHADCSMPFNKFIPTYHTYFGKQCRVSPYGFHKLTDLFAAISDTITLEGSSGTDHAVLILSLQEQLKAAGERIHAVLMIFGGTILISELEGRYLSTQIGVIDPTLFGFDSLEQLLNQLVDYVKVLRSPRGDLVHAAALVDTTTLSLRVRFLMFQAGKNSLPNTLCRSLYGAQYLGQDINIELAISRIPHTAQVTGNMVQLTPLAIFSNQVYTLLRETPDGVLFANLQANFTKRFGEAIQPVELGFPTLYELVNGFPEMFRISNNGSTQQRFIILNTAISEIGYPVSDPTYQQYSLWSGPKLFSSPDASTIPMPDARMKKNCWNVPLTGHCSSAAGRQ